MNSSLSAGENLPPQPVFFGKPCARCRKRSTCFGFCREFEVYLTMKNTRLIRVSCSKEHCTNKVFGLPCLFYNDGNCNIYRYAEWRVVSSGGGKGGESATTSIGPKTVTDGGKTAKDTPETPEEQLKKIHDILNDGPWAKRLEHAQDVLVDIARTFPVRKPKSV